jgi:hypothetical protein
VSNPVAGRLRIVTSPDLDPLKTRVFEAATGAEIFVSFVALEIGYRGEARGFTTARIECDRPLVEIASVPRELANGNDGAPDLLPVGEDMEAEGPGTADLQDGAADDKVSQGHGAGFHEVKVDFSFGEFQRGNRRALIEGFDGQSDLDAFAMARIKGKHAVDPDGELRGEGGRLEKAVDPDEGGPLAGSAIDAVGQEERQDGGLHGDLQGGESYHLAPLGIDPEAVIRDVKLGSGE